MTPSVDVGEFLPGFLAEADEHLDRIMTELAAIERAPERAHGRELAALFRSLHTMKGLAGMMGLEPIVAIAHAMESLVREAIRRGGALPQPALDPLVTGARAIAQRIRSVADSVEIAPAPEALLTAIEQLASAGHGRAPSAELAAIAGLEPALADELTASERHELQHARAKGECISPVVFTPSQTKATAGITITRVQASVARHGRIVRVLPHAVPRSPAAPGGLEFVLLVVSRLAAGELAAASGIAFDDVTALEVAAGPVTPAGGEDDPLARASRRGIVRMDVTRLDAALERLSTVTIALLRVREELAALAATGHELRRLRALLDDESRELRRLRECLLGLRMVRLREVLEPLPLVVRGLRNATGKRVQLAVEVGDAELDKTVAERLLPALVHLVRNAVDHGIEPADTRRERGKPEIATIRVEAAAPSSAMLEITVSDDGAGIDAELVARRAHSEVPVDDAALLDILTTPGFSMRATATTTSGRGLGLDIVRRAIEAVGGSFALENRRPHGTTWRMRAPLTIAILEAIAFEAGRERYLVPLAMVDAIVDVDPADVVCPPARAGETRPLELLRNRGELMPLASLREVLGLARVGDESKAMLVQRAGHRVAFAVGRMLGRREVLVRPLGDPLVRVPGISGSADLGDGRPTLVLDLPTLTSRVADGRAKVVSA